MKLFGSSVTEGKLELHIEHEFFYWRWITNSCLAPGPWKADVPNKDRCSNGLGK